MIDSVGPNAAVMMVALPAIAAISRSEMEEWAVLAVVGIVAFLVVFFLMRKIERKADLSPPPTKAS